MHALTTYFVLCVSDLQSNVTVLTLKELIVQAKDNHVNKITAVSAVTKYV